MSSQPPKKPSGSKDGRPSGAGGSASAGNRPRTAPPGGTQPTGSGAGRSSVPQRRPGVTRQPVAAQPGSFRERIDRVLPPFTAQRYIAIWVLGMIPLILLVLWLAQPWKGSNSGTNTNTNSGSAASTNATEGLGPGTYMVINTAKGTIVARVYTEESAKVPKTVANFVDKAKAGTFNGRVFHRVEDWVIQGGDPLGNGTGGGDMPSEYNTLTFKAGALGVARGGDPAINNDSQFFITKTAASWLDGQYTNWGEVVKGMEVVQQIAIGDKINSMTVEEKK